MVKIQPILLPAIPCERATKETIQALIDMGIIYIGDDNQIHCKQGRNKMIEVKKSDCHLEFDHLEDLLAETTILLASVKKALIESNVSSKRADYILSELLEIAKAKYDDYDSYENNGKKVWKGEWK